MIEGIEISRVQHKSDLEDWVIPIAISFSMSDSSAMRYLEIFESLHETQPECFLHFVAKSEGKVVAAATLFLEGEVAGLYNGATLASYRNRGILTALGATMLNEAKARGFKKATLQASPMSINLCHKAGFEEVVPYEVYLKVIP
jgi:GNAT superfamily N-acetyltransferase